MLERNDHRAIGARMDLFHFQEEAPGGVFWHPRGLRLYQLLEARVRAWMRRDGFEEVRTPQLLQRSIWQRSGHWDSFREGLFVIPGEDRELAVKPVNCPGHIQLFQRRSPSHRDLPIRLSEFGICHRNEPSGALQGLFRLCQFTQDDGHLFCLEEQVEAEVACFVCSLFEGYRSFGFEDVRIALATRPDVRAGDDAMWDRAEAQLGAAARMAGLAFEIHPGEGAFYGPKLEFTLSDRRGRDWQCGTIQLDFVMPQRFDIAYIAASGARERPVMLHRALLGSLERFLGMLLEHHEGHLPASLAPEQFILAPVSASQGEAARECLSALQASGLRGRVDARALPLSKRVFEAAALGIPWFLTMGPKEAADGTLSLRERDGRTRVKPLAEAVAWMVQEAST